MLNRFGKKWKKVYEKTKKDLEKKDIDISHSEFTDMIADGIRFGRIEINLLTGEKKRKKKKKFKIDFLD